MKISVWKRALATIIEGRPRVADARLPAHVRAQGI
jgi:hypothetical protein